MQGSGQEFDVDEKHHADSLKKFLAGSTDRKQVDFLNSLADMYAPFDFDSSTSYSAEAMRIATVIGYSYGIGCSRLYTGNAYYFRMDFKNALVSYLSAQTLFEEGDHFKELGELSMMLGHINFFIMRSEVAVKYYHKALEYNKAAGDDESVAETLYALNMAFWRDGPLDSALIAGKRLLDFSRTHHNRHLEALSLIIRGMTYNDETYNADSLLYYDHEALKIAQELNDNQLSGIIYVNIANINIRWSLRFENQGYLTCAYHYLDTATQAGRRSNFISLRSMIYQAIAYIELIEGEYAKARQNLDSAESFIRAYSQFPGKQPAPVGFIAFGKIFEAFLVLRTINQVHSSRFELAMKTGQSAEAIKYQQLYYESRDILQAAQQGRQLELLMAESEAERTDQKMRYLAQENELNRLKLSRNRFIFIGIAGAVLIVSLMLLLLFERKRLKAEKKSILMEQRLLRTQMNPHFLFNSLASIQNFMINEDTDRASTYLSRFSQLVRNILDSSAEEYIPLEKEIETIRNYLELQKVRYAGKFDYSIDIDADIDTEHVLVPPMLAQPFIENAVEHGVRHRETPGQITIRFKAEGSLIRFEVEDNGVGREKAREIESSKGSRHRSMATSITIDRLAAFNKKSKKKLGMEITDLKDENGEGCGTRVRFGIPLDVK